MTEEQRNDPALLAARLAEMSDDQLLKWARSPQPVSGINVAGVLLKELQKRGLADIPRRARKRGVR